MTYVFAKAELIHDLNFIAKENAKRRQRQCMPPNLLLYTAVLKTSPNSFLCHYSWLSVAKFLIYSQEENVWHDEAKIRQALHNISYICSFAT